VSEINTMKKKGRLVFKRMTFLGMLALIILAGLSAAGYAVASDNTLQVLPSDQMSIFDPFLLSSTVFSTVDDGDSESGSVILSEQSPILIPYRPVVRSPFRPPMT